MEMIFQSLRGNLNISLWIIPLMIVFTGTLFGFLFKKFIHSQLIIAAKRAIIQACSIFKNPIPIP